MTTTRKPLTVEQYRKALAIAKIDRDATRGCEELADHTGWLICLGSVWYLLTPDGRYSPR